MRSFVVPSVALSVVRATPEPTSQPSIQPFWRSVTTDPSTIAPAPSSGPDPTVANPNFTETSGNVRQRLVSGVVRPGLRSTSSGARAFNAKDLSDVRNNYDATTFDTALRFAEGDTIQDIASTDPAKTASARGTPTSSTRGTRFRSTTPAHCSANG
jgi:hypothetical protein